MHLQISFYRYQVLLNLCPVRRLLKARLENPQHLHVQHRYQTRKLMTDCKASDKISRINCRFERNRLPPSVYKARAF